MITSLFKNQSKTSICLVIIPFLVFMYSFEVQVGKSFKNKKLGNIAIPYVDKNYVYTFGVDGHSCFFQSFNKSTLELVKQKDIDAKIIENEYGKILSIKHSYDGKKITIKFNTDKEGVRTNYMADFEIDKFLSGEDNIIYEKNITENKSNPFTGDAYESIATWKLFKTEGAESHFFGAKINKECEVLYKKIEASTGKVLKTYDFLLNEDFSLKYWEEYQKNKTFSMHINKFIESEDNSVYVFATLNKTGSYYYSGSYVSETIHYTIYEDIWVFKFTENKGFQWGKVIPMIKSHNNSSNDIKGSIMFANFSGFGVAEKEDKIYVIYNDHDRNDKKFDGYNGTSKLYDLPTRNSEDGVLVVVTLDKKNQNLTREVVNKNHKSHSFINCNGGYQDGSDIYMVDDMRKKNQTRIFKLKL